MILVFSIEIYKYSLFIPSLNFAILVMQEYVHVVVCYVLILRAHWLRNSVYIAVDQLEDLLDERHHHHHQLEAVSTFINSFLTTIVVSFVP